MFISLFSLKIASILGIVAFNIIKFILNTARFFSKLEMLNIIVVTPSILFIIFYYLCISLIFSSKFQSKLKYKIIFYLIIISFVFYILSNIIPRNFIEISAIDVGQGDSFLIETSKNKKILIDGGGNENGSFDVGENILLPYLLNKGIKKVDIIIISHADTDHIDGLFEIIKKIKVERVVIGKQFEVSENFEKLLRMVKEKNIKINIVEVGNKIFVEENLYLDILWPSSKYEIKENSLNNNSVVCKLYYNDFSMLFTGDIEKIAEEQIVDLYKSGNNLSATVLKVAHHGSKSSSTDEFVKLVKPEIVVMGVGKGNKYNHPNDEIIERFENLGVDIYRTDKDGEISIFVNEKGNVKVKRFID